MINTIKKAMTLGEVLICLAIIGVIAVLTLPAMFMTVPDKGESLHKKADYTLEHTVSDIVNNDYYYPNDDETNYGLNNTVEVTEDGVTYEGETKFCMLMASKFTLYPGTEVDCSKKDFDAEWDDDDTITFKSSDGIKWRMPVSDFGDDEDEDELKIQFRTADRKSGDDCEYDPDDADECTDPNIFTYSITREGKLYKDYATNDKIKPTYD